MISKALPLLPLPPASVVNNESVAIEVDVVVLWVVKVYIPLVVYVVPFHVYESQAVSVALPLVVL
jgi:hypothetical protein